VVSGGRHGSWQNASHVKPSLTCWTHTLTSIPYLFQAQNPGLPNWSQVTRTATTTVSNPTQKEIKRFGLVARSMRFILTLRLREY
jgi:hypothetical protein